MQDPLKILLDAEQPEGRRIEAAKAIGRARDLSAIDRMFAVTERAEALLTRAVVEALKEMDAHEVLVRRLTDTDAAVRADAAKKLSKMQEPRATEPLIGAARDPEATVRRAAVHALSYLRGSRVYDALVSSVRDPDAETRAYAAAGLGRSGDARAPRILISAREGEADEVVKDFIDAALRKNEAPAAK
jgi:HEAT repeat protein